MSLSAADVLLFVVLPYVAILTAIAGSIYRYRARPFTFSSLSSQFLEGDRHFWALPLFHYGIIGVLAGHLVGLVLPTQVLAWNARPLRLYVLEATGLALAFLALVGLLLAMFRRIADARVRQVTARSDWLLLPVLLLQLGTGIAIAVRHPWGSYWYQASAVPYLQSLFTLRPDAGPVAALPWSIKAHVVGAWLLVLMIPFTRLVHMLVAPLHYLARAPLVTRWRAPRAQPAAGMQPAGNALQLALGTGAFALCFSVFGSVSAMMPIMRDRLKLDPVQVSIAIAIPILLGSLGRIPLGILTDRYGGRVVFSAVMAFSIIPSLAMGRLSDYTAILFFGFFIGLALASFSVGVAFVSGWYPPQQQGTALGIYGAGNIGQSLAAFGSPVLAASLGYVWGFQTFAILLAAWLVPFVAFARNAPRRTAPKTLVQMAAPLKEMASWKLSLYYFLTFGGFVAMAVYLPVLLTGTFHLTPKDAGFRTAGFIVLATAMRPIGGWIADKVGGRTVLVLVFPVVALAAGFLTSTGILWFSVGALTMAAAIGLGNGAVFKLVPQYFPHAVGAVTGLVGAAGGLGGFFPPLVLGLLKKHTGNYTIGFVLLGLFSLACLITIRSRILALCLTPPENGEAVPGCRRKAYCKYRSQCEASQPAHG